MNELLLLIFMSSALSIASITILIMEHLLTHPNPAVRLLGFLATIMILMIWRELVYRVFVYRTW